MNARTIAWLRLALSIFALTFTMTQAAVASTYYVSPTGSDANAGTVDAPFLTIQHAVDASTAGDTVVLGDGTYTGPGDVTIKIPHDLNIQSANGASKTIIDCGGNSQAFSPGVSTNTQFVGLTIKNGNVSLGGAIEIVSSTVTIRDCVFTDNNATQGGAISNLTSSTYFVLSISRCLFTRNAATYGGGAIENAGGTVACSECCFLDNAAASNYYIGGGAIQNLLYGSVTARNCIFADNTSDLEGGAISNHAGEIQVANCAFTGNTAATSGGAIYNPGNQTLTLTNDILWNDSAPVGPEIDNLGTLTATYSDIQGGWAGQGNIALDPLFVDPVNGNLHLQPGSPCTAAGVSIDGITTDLDGVVRPSHPTIGAYEVAPGAPLNPTAAGGDHTVLLTWSKPAGATSYHIYRGTASGGEGGTPYRTVTSTSLTDTNVGNGTTYYYRIAAVDTAGEGPKSVEVHATPVVPHVAFVKIDTTTQGNWKGHYGADGHNVIGDTSGDNPHYRDYVSATPGTHYSGLWAVGSQAPQCLQATAVASTNRIGGVWFNTTWSMNVNVTGTHQLALYFLDYPNSGYAETITIKDTVTGALLDTRSISAFQAGKYEVWNVSGNVTITLTSTASHWAPISGIFFG